MIVFNKNSICSTNYKGIEDFWTSYKHVELIVYFLFKNDILIPLKIKKSDYACQEYLQNGNVVPIATKIYGYPKPFFKYR